VKDKANMVQLAAIGLPLKLYKILDSLCLKNVELICMEQEPHEILLLVEECLFDIWLDHRGLVDRLGRAKVFLYNIFTEHWHQIYCIPDFEHF
jgi:hypothetical protein